ncbi:hypothetical protein [Sulfitobacter sp.]|uniref:hypothetical protein n=1 Tax=Sulfitobacter sp. TaxID=1903071 RepID=UPI003001ABA1
MRFLPVMGVVLGLAACGDPLAGVDRLADVDVAQTDRAAAALPDADEVAREGFLGTSAADGTVPAGVLAATSEKSSKEQSGGFFRKLVRRAADTDPAAAVAADVAQSQYIEDSAPVEPVELAALPEPTTGVLPKSRGIGLFGGGKKQPSANLPRRGPDARDVPFGTVLAFGEIARVCDARGKSMGRKVESNGRRGFVLYDSQPGIRDKRTFYITGFDDNCPRQFTAANALFGAPSFYEQIRFSPAGKNLPFGATDKAYDKIKSSVCRAAKNKPCGKKISTLDGNTAFISAYEFNEHNGKWKEFLVHDGVVIAATVKSTN